MPTYPSTLLILRFFSKSALIDLFLLDFCRLVRFVGMECGFLSQKGSGGRGVKEKNANDSNIEAVKEKNLNDGSMMMEVQSPVVDHTNVVRTSGGSYPPLPTQRTTLVGNTPGKSSYANVIGESSKKAVKLYGVLIIEFNDDGLSVIATKLGTSLMLDSDTADMCLQSWGRSSYTRVTIELWADIKLKDNIVVFGHNQEEYPKNIRLGVAKNLKKPSVLVGLKVGFKPHKDYRPEPKKPTASPNGNKQGVAHTNVVSNLYPFDVLNSVDNDVEFGTNGWTINLVNNGATSSILMDEVGNPLKKVEFLSDCDSEDKVASVGNDMAHSLASERVGFGTQSFLEQWRDSYGNGDYDEYPYDDDMYEGQDIPQEIQAICDNLDIRVRGRKNK
uniref:Uncharacterized protein n=1 Tax=Tanacetum cinerariifolium TaxID=118510 RepID=A0A6L2M8I7_TANCI|nr:hypothetical protein [Tanacetum cinerariifolium]